jgi:hypothetical protein
VNARLVEPSRHVNRVLRGEKIPTDGDVIVVIEANEVSEFQMSSQTGSLAGDALHGTAIAKDAVGVVGNEVESGLVERGSSMRLGNSESNRIANTLSQRTSGDLDTGSLAFRMSRGFAVDLLDLSDQLLT